METHDLSVQNLLDLIRYMINRSVIDQHHVHECDISVYLEDPGDHVFVDLQVRSVLQTLQQSQDTS